MNPIKRGLTSYIAVLFLVGIATFGGVLLYGSLSNIVRTNTEIDFKKDPIILEASSLNEENLTIYLRNPGQNKIKLDAFYINSVKLHEPDYLIMINEQGEADDEINEGEVSKIVITSAEGFQTEVNYDFKIITHSGQIINFNIRLRSDERIPQEPIVLEGSQIGSVVNAGIRYRSFGNTGSEEIYIGGPDLGVGSQRVGSQYVWIKPGLYKVSFYHDKAFEIVYTVVNGTIVSKSGYTGFGWNYMQIDVVERDAGTTVALREVVLNGYSLGDFEGNGWKTWSVTGLDLSEGFILIADLVLEGSFGSSQELSKVQIFVGSIQ